MSDVDPLDGDRGEPRGRSLDSLSRAFLRFADVECGAEPLYDALCRLAAARPDVLQLLWAAPPSQQRPNLLLAAIHDVLLGGTDHPLREYFPSVGGTRRADAGLASCFDDFERGHRAELLARIDGHATQTNEIGRGAVLWPALAWIARELGRERFALIDFGASAGLNLGVDRYHYDYGSFTLGAEPTEATPVVRCRLVGPKAPPADGSAPFELVFRLGLDVAPIDVNDPAAVRWLRACIWPHDHERARRFELAAAIARQHGWNVQRHSDCITALERAVASLPPEVAPVVLNSWVVTYLDPEERARYVETLERLVQRAGAGWLSAEHPSLGIGGEAPRSSLAGAEYAEGSIWSLCLPGAGGPRYTSVARSHPHGAWLEWLAEG